MRRARRAAAASRFALLDDSSSQREERLGNPQRLDDRRRHRSSRATSDRGRRHHLTPGSLPAIPWTALPRPLHLRLLGQRRPTSRFEGDTSRSAATSRTHSGARNFGRVTRSRRKCNFMCSALFLKPRDHSVSDQRTVPGLALGASSMAFRNGGRRHGTGELCRSRRRWAKRTETRGSAVPKRAGGRTLDRPQPRDSHHVAGESGGGTNALPRRLCRGFLVSQGYTCWG